MALWAARLLAAVTFLVTATVAFTAWLLDRHEFPNFGRAIWWSAQTVTTVGYGDTVPHEVLGRIVAVVAMVSGVAFIAVITAVVTATLIGEHRRMSADADEDRIAAQLEQISGRLAALEAAATRR